jgi:hypothetical protein
MIINTGSRTDIPAYYSEWFYNRIKEGFVCARNPYYPEQLIRYELSPEIVDCLVFCTKNPEPMLPGLQEIKQFRQFWFVTITPYGKEIEPYVPPKDTVMDAFCRLSQQVGLASVGWRYDPIFISEKYTLEFHLHAFESMAKKLSGSVDNCVISFIDLYEKTKKNFPQARKVTKEERQTIGREFAKIGRTYGILIRACCEGTELSQYGVDCSGCMTQQVIERAIDNTLAVPKGKPARAECQCLLGSDIGAYNSCGHGCLYCYANYDMKIVEQNRKRHNPKSPLLIGEIESWEQVKQAKQESWIDGQLRLF